MKYKEYAIYDLDSCELDIKANVEKALHSDIDCISVPYFYTKLVRSVIGDSKIMVANAIDYPFGISDIKTRNQSISSAISNGADAISVVFHNNYLSNKKYDKIRQDVSSNLEICKQSNVSINFYLEYRIFTHQALIKACNILMEFGIDKIYVSTGYMLDNINDNIIAINLLQEKTKIQPIFTANIWNKDHITLLDKNNISHIRFNNLNSIRTYNDFTKV